MDSMSSSNSMDSELYEAATKGYLNYLQRLTPEQKSNLTSQLAPNKNTLLHIATEFHQLEFAKSVVEICPELLRQQNSLGDTALHVAAREDLVDFVKFFIEKARIKMGNVENERPQVRQLEMVNSDGDTAVHCAARLGHDKSLEKLVRACPEVCSIVNNSTESPLYLAAASGYFDIHQIIIDSAPSLASYQGPNGLTALHPTLFFRHFDIEKMRSLVEWKREMIKARDHLGWTPLHYASFYGRTEAIKLFLEYERSAVYILDNNGGSPLHIAAFQGHIDAVEEILNSCPTSCYLTDNNGRTALHAAVLSDQRKLVMFFLKAPELTRLMDKPDRDGNMPLHLAAHFKLYVIIEILRKTGRVNWEIKNKMFLTALDVYNKHNEEGLRASVTRHLLDGRMGTMTMQHLADKEMEKMNQEIRIDISPHLETRTGTNEDCSYFEKKSALEVNLLVATLVATVTFAAGFQMPGGNFDASTRILTTKAAFKMFVVFNTVAFSCSVFAVLLQFHTSLTNHKQQVRYMGIASLLTTTAIFAMVMAFASGTHVLLTKSLGFSVTPYVICGCFAVLYFALPFCDPGVEGFPCLRRPQKFVRDLIVQYVRYEE